MLPRDERKPLKTSANQWHRKDRRTTISPRALPAFQDFDVLMFRRFDVCIRPTAQKSKLPNQAILKPNFIAISYLVLAMVDHWENRD